MNSLVFLIFFHPCFKVLFCVSKMLWRRGSLWTLRRDSERARKNGVKDNVEKDKKAVGELRSLCTRTRRVGRTGPRSQASAGQGGETITARYMIEAGVEFQKLRGHWGSASLGESEKTSESWVLPTQSGKEEWARDTVAGKSLFRAQRCDRTWQGARSVHTRWA